MTPTMLIPSNLHSIMLLLYLAWQLLWKNCDLIYIPLCFYFIPSVTSDKPPFLHIYIPLCFYFIAAPPQSTSGIRQNLHSIMLLLYRRTRWTAWSAVRCIYIPLCFYFIEVHVSHKVGFANLHSIMLLLYPVSNSS